MVDRIGLEKKVAVVTGGYGHLGSAISQAMIGHGAKVYVLGRSESAFNSLKEISNNHPELHFQSCDVGDSNAIRHAFSSIAESAGRLDILVNNAFYLKGEIPEKLNDEDWAFGIDGTLNSVFRCIREVLPYIADGGRILNIGSMYGSISPDFNIYSEHPKFFNPPNYGAAKAGIAQLSRYFAHYLGNRQITVNCISPGAFPNQSVREERAFIQKLEAHTALGRIGFPEDLGGICVFLASSHAAYITGQNIHVDGGWTSR